MCDVCGRPVQPEDAYQEDVSVSQMMCPTPMTFHSKCYEAASSMWQPDKSCLSVDPEFPEMRAWAQTRD